MINIKLETYAKCFNSYPRMLKSYIRNGLAKSWEESNYDYVIFNPIKDLIKEIVLPE